MVQYKCDKCEMTFTKKSNYIVHTNRKTSCVVEYNVTEDGKYECMYCHTVFTRVDNCNVHINNCNLKITKLKDDEINELKKELEEKNKKIEDMTKILNSISQSDNKIINQTTNNTTDNSTHTDNSNTIITDNSTNNINNDNSITNNTVNNIITIKFGDEDLNKLNFKEIKSILTSGYQAVPESFKLTNCNPRLPEQINAYIPNLRAPYAYVYDGEGYVLKDLNEVLEDIILNKASDIQELYNINSKHLTAVQQRSIQGLLKKVKENDKQIMTDDKKEIKIAMYNNRDKIESFEKAKKTSKKK